MDDPVEVTPAEATALQTTWNSLGPLMACAIKKLGRKAGLEVCVGLAKGDLLPTWILTPGKAVCVISRDADVIYSFEFLHEPRQFAFVEIGAGPTN